MKDIDFYKDQFTKKREDLLNDYFTFLRFKSITTDPKYKDEVEACAQWLFDYLKESTLKVEKWETGRAPIIFAQDLRAGPEKETLLIYCHYDVQPVDPLELWTTPPFEPTLREGEVYARGAADNKGQCFYTIQALKALLKVHERLPINIKFIIEGEEESGSIGLSHILDQKKEALKADYLMVVDSGIHTLQRPAITLGARGICGLEVTLKESDFDLHSGAAGGLAYNPNRALVKMLTQLHDAEGRVVIPGFYDDILPLTQQEKEAISFDFDEAAFKSMFGFTPTGMEKGFTPNEACWLRPTLEINGMWGGYAGVGFKTVIPAEAHAKISCRLVPNQNPEKVLNLVKDYLIKITPPALKIHIAPFHEGGKGCGMSFRTHPFSRIATIMSESYAQVFGKPCEKILLGGSIPIAARLCEVAEAEMLLVGLGLPDDRIHAPNEHFGLDRLEKGYLTICRAIELFG